MDCVAQLVRALDCGSRGRGFEPHHGPLNSNKFFASKNVESYPKKVRFFVCTKF